MESSVARQVSQYGSDTQWGAPEHVKDAKAFCLETTVACASRANVAAEAATEEEESQAKACAPGRDKEKGRSM